MRLTAHGRYSEPGLLVLVSLLSGPKHGYAIAEDVEKTLGRRLGPGTLYGAISRLESSGLIVAERDGGRRKPYRLAPAGLAEVERELDALAEVSKEGRKRLSQLRQRLA